METELSTERSEANLEEGKDKANVNAHRVGGWIAQLRREKGYTQRELAQRLSVTDKAVSRWETGKGLPDTGLLQALSKELDVTVGELLSGQRLEEPGREQPAAETAPLRQETLSYLKRRLPGLAMGTMLAAGVLLLLSPLVLATAGRGTQGAFWCGVVLTAASLLLLLFRRRGSCRRLGEKGAAPAALCCLLTALLLEILPYGVVLNFARPDQEPFRRYYSYFSLTPFGYANFAPLPTGILTGIACLLLLLRLVQGGGSARLRSAAFGLSVAAAVLSLVPLVMFGTAYMSAVSYLVTGLTTASAALQAVANRRDG